MHVTSGDSLERGCRQLKDLARAGKPPVRFKMASSRFGPWNRRLAAAVRGWLRSERRKRPFARTKGTYIAEVG